MTKTKTTWSRRIRAARFAAARWLAPEAFAETTQVALVATATFTPTEMAIASAITTAARMRVYTSFRPRRAKLTETVCAIYGGAANCWPTVPIETGISGPALSAADISWPPIASRTDIVANFAILPSVLSRATGRCACGAGRLPPGYDAEPKSIKVTIHMDLFGPQM